MSEFRFTKNASDEVIKITEITDEVVTIGADAGRKTIVTDIVPASGDVTPSGADLVMKDSERKNQTLTVLFP